MSISYRDPPKWKQNASQQLDVQFFQRMQAASTLCDGILRVAAQQLKIGDDHVKAGGDFLEVLLGTEKYEKVLAASAEEAAPGSSSPAAGEKVPAGPEPVEPDPLMSAGDNAKTEPKPKRRYMPRMNATPIYVLAMRALDLQEKLAPVVHALGQQLVAAGVDVRRLMHEDIIAQVIRDEFGVELSEISAAEYDVLRDTLRKSQAWLEEFRREHADEIRQREGGPKPGEDRATGG